MGYKQSDPCLEKAYEDERLFVLMTRDDTAPEVVLEWIKLNLRSQPEMKLREAFECALEMIKRGPMIRLRRDTEKMSETGAHSFTESMGIEKPLPKRETLKLATLEYMLEVFTKDFWKHRGGGPAIRDWLGERGYNPDEVLLAAPLEKRIRIVNNFVLGYGGFGMIKERIIETWVKTNFGD